MRADHERADGVAAQVLHRRARDGHRAGRRHQESRAGVAREDQGGEGSGVRDDFLLRVADRQQGTGVRRGAMSRGNRGDERERKREREGGWPLNRHSVSADGYSPVCS